MYTKILLDYEVYKRQWVILTTKSNKLQRIFPCKILYTTITIMFIILGIPYLHAIFHLLSSVAAYNVFVMFSLIDIYRHSSLHSYKCRIKSFSLISYISFPYITLDNNTDTHEHLWFLFIFAKSLFVLIFIDQYCYINYL